ncbi:MAG: head-tail joining protein [Burkholderiaceae bacterium]
MQEDLDSFVQDFGVPCVFGAQQFIGVYDAPGELDDFGERRVHSVQHQLRYISAQATLARGISGTVGGQAFTVREAALPVGDGKFSTVLLTKT